VPPEEALKVFGINVLGALYLVQETVPHMPRGSRIINIGSVVSKLGVDFMSTYAASKAALDSYTFSWAEEVRTLSEVYKHF
jgi:NAD(P)-dependent dehydrogenase (short-subunit alcohol dehydrogenase family)